MIEGIEKDRSQERHERLKLKVEQMKFKQAEVGRLTELIGDPSRPLEERTKFDMQARELLKAIEEDAREVESLTGIKLDAIPPGKK